MKNLIVMNWKMNPESLAKAVKLSVFSDKRGIVLCPPSLFLSDIKKLINNAELGSQNCFWEKEGAFTGEISAAMLKKNGCKYVIIGHSERRRNLNENDEMANRKIKAALRLGLAPIVCIGNESKDKTEEFNKIKGQLKNIFLGVKPSSGDKIVVAYEPIWAISTSKGSKVATPERAEESAVFIAKVLAEIFGKKRSEDIKIIYGGSVNGSNMASFIKRKMISGALVGAASLDFRELKKIFRLIS